VTLRCRLSADEVRQRFQGPVLGLVREMAEVWFKSRESIVFHDPLAAALVFAPELCKYERGVVTIEPGTARTLFTPDRSGTDDVAVEVNAPAYFSEFFRLCGAPI
jgi:purine nucleosidase